VGEAKTVTPGAREGGWCLPTQRVTPYRIPFLVVD
jgi:hypothetical protein